LSAEPRIGVYVCHCGTNIAGFVDVTKVVEYAKALPYVVVARDYRYMCSDPGQRLIKEDIKTYSLNRIVIAACSPRLHEPTFRKVAEEAGLNPYLVEMANIREQDSWVHMDNPSEATEKAKDLVRMAVARAALLEPLEKVVVPVKKAALVIGGGIAGISAALDLAEAGYPVYLVEEKPSIGGHMAQLDKTFPTMDCSACILTPKMVEVSRHPNIKLKTYSEVVGVEGTVGSFKVKVLMKPRFVIEDKCTACGECAQACPVEVPNEFDMGLSWRKAIYIPFPQAVPNAYVLDLENCLGITPEACLKCKEVCEADAIDYDMQPKIEEIEVGTIIVATGYDTYNPVIDPEYGYGRYPNVLTSLEVERLLNAAGPTGGKLVRPSDGRPPKRIVYVQCVGSRNKNRNPYCSRVCCMYAVKQARQIKEKYPDAQVTIFYIDLRAFGKGYEEFYEAAQREYGVSFVRGRVSKIVEDPETHNLVVRAEDTLLGTPVEVEADMVVLSVGIAPSEGTRKIADILGLSKSPDGFLMEAHAKLRPVDTMIDGVFLCGTAQGPKDIPDSVAQAKGAAASAIALMSRGALEVEPYQAEIDQSICGMCGICVSICPFNAIVKSGEAYVVDKSLCKGCGACAAACPSGAIKFSHFTDMQLLAQVKAAFAGW